MRIGLDSPQRRAFFLLSAAVITLPYLIWVQAEYRASMWAQSIDLKGLQRAVEIDPSNSDYWHILGRFRLLISQDAEKASSDLTSALALNPNESRYWMDLATAQRVLGNYKLQQHALEEAIRTDPKTPQVAWEAGNFFLADGQTEKALDSFKTVIENDPVNVGAALSLCWRATHDVDLVLAHAMPAQVGPHVQFIYVLTQAQQPAAAMIVWRSLMKLNQQPKIQELIPFVQYLASKRQVDDASEVWAGLGRYSPSLRPASGEGNLITNGDFEEEIIPGGFSWNLQPVPDTLTAKVDEGEFHAGSSSLAIHFKGSSFGDSGISQLVAVKPNSRYELFVDAKSEEIQSANGPRVIVVDAFTNAPIVMGTEWQGTHVWAQEAITLSTGPGTNLVRVLIARSPSAGLIRGRLWIDNVRMYQR